MTPKMFVLAGTLLISGCAPTLKYLVVSGGSKADGTLTMAYEYTNAEYPEVQWDAANVSATERCSGWGYSGAELFGAYTKDCVRRSATGGQCVRWRVTYTYQCVE